MFGAIPFFQLQVYNLAVPGMGNLPIDPWATLVCIGFVVGLEMARARGIKLGLDVRDIVDGAVFIVLSGFFWGHVITVLFYFPERLKDSGIMAILRVWEGFSSTGGFLGAVIGAWLFYKYVRPAPAAWKGPWALRHADVIAYGFPFGWFFGRLGCGSVHDHIGKLTTFPLAMDFDHGIGPWVKGAGYAHGIRHELGLYEAALLVPLMVAFWVLGRKDRVPGFFVGLFAACYAPVRFLLEFLRNDDLLHQDARYYGLTPAQYGMIIMGLVAVVFLTRLDYKGWRGADLSRSPTDPAPTPSETAPDAADPVPPSDPSGGADPAGG